MQISRRNFVGSTAGITLASTVRGASLVEEVRFPFYLSGPLPTLQHGLVAALDSELRAVNIVDLRGKIVSSFSPHIPDAAIERVLHVATSKEKKIATAISAKDVSGRYSSFLAFVDVSGKMTRLVQTHPFASRRILYLPNGRLIALGRHHDDSFHDVPNHNVLRFFSADGVLENNALEVTGLRTGTSGHPLTWLMSLGTDRIGLMDIEDRRYCEVDFGGKLIRPLEPLGVSAPDRPTGIALLASGERIVTFDRPKMSGGRPHYGYTCGAVQVSGGAGSRLEISPRTDLVPPGEGVFVTALGCHEGRIILLARPVDRILIYEA